jgi:hypothetical protein
VEAAVAVRGAPEATAATAALAAAAQAQAVVVEAVAAAPRRPAERAATARPTLSRRVRLAQAARPWAAAVVSAGRVTMVPRALEAAPEALGPRSTQAMAPVVAVEAAVVALQAV